MVNFKADWLANKESMTLTPCLLQNVNCPEAVRDVTSKNSGDVTHLNYSLIEVATNEAMKIVVHVQQPLEYLIYKIQKIYYIIRFPGVN